MRRKSLTLLQNPLSPSLAMASLTAHDLIRQLRAHLSNPELALQPLLSQIDTLLASFDPAAPSAPSLAASISLDLREIQLPEGDAKALGSFVLVLGRLMPILGWASIREHWWEAVLVRALERERDGVLDEEAMEEAREMVLKALDGNPEFGKVLLSRYIAELGDSSEDGLPPLDRPTLAKTLQHLLLSYTPRRPSAFFTLLSHLFPSRSNRLPLLQLLLSTLRQHPIHAYSLLATPLFPLLLRSLHADPSAPAVQLGLTALSILLPRAPEKCAPHVPALCAALGRVLVWRRRKDEALQARVFELEQPQHPPMTLRPHETEGEGDDAGVPFEPLEGQRTDDAPSPMPFFTFLYGLFPANVLSFLRSPHAYLRAAEWESPFVEDLDRWLYEDLIKARSLPLLRTHLIHPASLKYTLSDPASERAETPARWKNVPAEGVIAQCVVLEVGAGGVVEEGRRIAEGIVSVPDDDAQGEEGEVAREAKKSEEARLRAEREIEESAAEAEGEGEEGERVRQLRRELVLLRNEFEYELYLKQNILLRLGQLHRRRLAEARDDDAQQSLYIHLRSLQTRLNQATTALSAARAEAAKTQARHVAWTEELQRKVAKFREEKKAWDAEAVQIRGAQTEAEEMIKVQMGRLAEAGNRIFALENQIREWEPKMEKISSFEARNAELVQKLADRDADILAHQEQRREMEILLGRFDMLRRMWQSEKKAREEAEEEVRQARLERDELQARLESFSAPSSSSFPAPPAFFSPPSAPTSEASSALRARNLELEETILTLRAELESLRPIRLPSPDPSDSDEDASTLGPAAETRSVPPLRSPGSMMSLELPYRPLSIAQTETNHRSPVLSLSSATGGGSRGRTAGGSAAAQAGPPPSLYGGVGSAAAALGGARKKPSPGSGGRGDMRGL